MYQSAPAYVIVPLIGADGAGKTTLWRALGEAAQQRDPAVAPRSIQMQGGSASLFDVRYGAPSALQIVDFADAFAEQILFGATRFGAAVLVVSATESVVEGTRQSVERAQLFGVPIVAVALTQCDKVDDVEMTDLIVLEVRELLNKYRMGGDQTTVVPMPGLRMTARGGREPEMAGGADVLLQTLCR